MVLKLKKGCTAKKSGGEGWVGSEPLQIQSSAAVEHLGKATNTYK